MRSRIASSTVPRERWRNTCRIVVRATVLSSSTVRKVDRPLRFHPLAIEARLTKLRMGHDVGHADRLFGPEGEMTIEQRIELHVAVPIELTETGVGAKMLVNLDRKPR
jgi:hypothetical protein